MAYLSQFPNAESMLDAAPIAPRRQIAASGPAGWLQAGVAPLLRMLDRQRQRRALLDLDDRQLRDIGRSREEAIEEARKPFWM